MKPVYRHTQFGRVTVAALTIGCAAMLWWAVLTGHPVPIVLLMLLAPLILIFSSLTVVVRDRVLEVAFGASLIRRRIPLDRIRDARAVRSPWYYGWGIRLTPRGWLWNVSGFGGVELEFDDGRRFRIGSDEPDELAETLRREISRGQP